MTRSETNCWRTLITPLNFYVRILMASRFIQLVPTNHFPFWHPPKIKICPPLAPRSGITFSSRISSPSTLEHATYQKTLHRKLTPMDASNSMRTNNLTALIELQASCQSLLQVTLKMPLMISWSNLKAMHIRSATNPPNKKIAKLRRCSLAFQRVYAPRVSCVPFGMGLKMWEDVVHC